MSSTVRFFPFLRLQTRYHHNFLLFRLKIEILDCIILIFAVEMVSVMLIWRHVDLALSILFSIQNIHELHT